MNAISAVFFITVFLAMLTVVRSQPIINSQTTQSVQATVIPELEVIPGLEYLTSDPSSHGDYYKMFNPIKHGLLPIFWRYFVCLLFFYIYHLMTTRLENASVHASKISIYWLLKFKNFNKINSVLIFYLLCLVVSFPFFVIAIWHFTSKYYASKVDGKAADCVIEHVSRPRVTPWSVLF